MIKKTNQSSNTLYFVSPAPEPAVDPEVNDPEDELPTANVEEEPTASIDTTPAQGEVSSSFEKVLYKKRSLTNIYTPNRNTYNN